MVAGAGCSQLSNTFVSFLVGELGQSSGEVQQGQGLRAGLQRRGGQTQAWPCHRQGTDGQQQPLQPQCRQAAPHIAPECHGLSAWSAGPSTAGLRACGQQRDASGGRAVAVDPRTLEGAGAGSVCSEESQWSLCHHIRALGGPQAGRHLARNHLVLAAAPYLRRPPQPSPLAPRQSWQHGPWRAPAEAAAAGA